MTKQAEKGPFTMNQFTLPDYSVLMSVCAHDCSPWVEAALLSMIRQTLPPAKIILVEDGPVSKEIHEVENKLLKAYPGLIHIQSLEKNQGLAGAMRRGLEACHTEWIARMDADDLSAPERCEKELRYAITKGADIVGCDCSEFQGEPSNTDAKRLFPAEHEELVAFSRRKTPFCHPSVMMKKSAVERAGNYREIHLLEDYDLFVRMLRTGSVGCTLKENLYHVRVGEDFYSRRGGFRYVSTLVRFNYRLLKSGWTRPKDFIIRSCGNIVVGLAPSSFRAWMYRRFLRK